MSASTDGGGRMSEATDQQQIIDVTIKYCWALDTNEWHELDDVFLPDATAQLGQQSCANRDEIKQTCSNALTSLDDSQHIVATHQVAIDGNAATSRCYLHAQHVKRFGGEEIHYVVAGRYEDRLVRTPAGWRIAHRDLIVMWTDGDHTALRR